MCSYYCDNDDFEDDDYDDDSCYCDECGAGAGHEYDCQC